MRTRVSIACAAAGMNIWRKLTGSPAEQPGREILYLGTGAGSNDRKQALCG